ncbi:LamB/YcsF family protein [Anaerotruncus rubiinfantis]|uniref:LamB/YcsF family protein n=1 Tax=Anaerotruncus rubiinfantis TaxID=1720200 RepID=UPI0011C8FB9F|nr:5-oxoprolinase subunit PxpA [Anaerotruncus rubiinfantis]
MYKIDMNSDMGESFGAYTLGCDEEIIKCVSSANLACGWHAGDPVVMDNRVKLCHKYGVAVGAHPGYPDLMGFGRRKMTISYEELKAYVKYQIGALNAFVTAEGMKLQHVIPHGAFGNLHMVDHTASLAICDAILEVDPDIILMTPASRMGVQVAKERGVRYASAVFADRAYNDDLTLVARGTPGAVIRDPEEAVKRVIRMVKEGVVTTVTGKEVPIEAHTICTHGDTLTAVEIVRSMRVALEAEEIQIANLNEIV